MLLIIIGASYYQDGDIAAPIVCFLVTVILLPDDSAPEDTDLGQGDLIHEEWYLPDAFISGDPDVLAPTMMLCLQVLIIIRQVYLLPLIAAVQLLSPLL